MGNGGSKPEQHVFNADAPVTLSQSVVNSLQSSSQSDSIRAKDVELKVQSRLNAELTRIRNTQAKKLTELTTSLTTEPSKDSSSSSSEPQREPNSLAAHLSSPFYHDFSDSKSSGKADSGRSSDSVNKEIADLRAKLDARKKLEKVSPEVEKAKEELTECLRTNDRRPLDCWKEVETFKAEVGKLERAFIQKAGR